MQLRAIHVLRALLHKVATILDTFFKKRNCSMMTRWHHSDSSKARSAEHESVKKKTLDLSSRSKWFSAGLISGFRFTLLQIPTLVCAMRHRNQPSCQNMNNNLTGSSDFTLKSLLPINWQQPFQRKIAAAS